MKALRLGELEELLKSPAFKAWARTLDELCEEEKQTQSALASARDELTVVKYRREAASEEAEQLIFKAGTYESRASEAAAAGQDQENAGFAALHEFEAQRQRATDAWQKFTAAEIGVDTLSKQLDSNSNVSEKSRLEHEQRKATLVKEDLGGALKQAEERRAELWDKVESSWAEDFVQNVRRAEYQYLARKVRSQAESLYQRQQADDVATVQAKIRALEAKSEVLESRRQALHLSVQRDFFCFWLEDFLYWPQRESDKLAFCVPLADISDGLNLAVQKFAIYQIDRSRGVDWLSAAGD